MSSKRLKKSALLVLAGIDLNFFIVACMWLCSGYVIKTLVIIH